jgi:hypothetical protein
MAALYLQDTQKCTHTYTKEPKRNKHIYTHTDTYTHRHWINGRPSRRVLVQADGRCGEGLGLVPYLSRDRDRQIEIDR